MKPIAKIQASFFFKPVFRLLLAACIFIFSFFPSYVEQWYSVGIYPAIAATQRMITGRLPFSAGDILYILIIIWLIIKLVKLVKLFQQYHFSRSLLGIILMKLFSVLLWVYIIFKLLWGLNYNRLGIEHQLQLTQAPYTRTEITALTNDFIDSLNHYRKQLDSVLPVQPLDSIYREAYHSYQNLSYQYPFLYYANRSVKASLYSGLADYIGFTGYYNPFTGEAQLRTDIPRILTPYVVCHEMAHQLGYASESEANFVGYLAASSAKSLYFRYSVYLELFSYAQGEQVTLYVQEKDFKGFEAAIHNNRMRLDTLVKQDRQQIRNFFRKRQNRISPAMTSLYDQYLKMNRQLSGMKSYDEVIGWIIAYRKHPASP